MVRKIIISLILTLMLVKGSSQNFFFSQHGLPFDYIMEDQTIPYGWGEYQLISQNMIYGLTNGRSPDSLQVISYVSDYDGNGRHLLLRYNDCELHPSSGGGSTLVPLPYTFQLGSDLFIFPCLYAYLEGEFQADPDQILITFRVKVSPGGSWSSQWGPIRNTIYTIYDQTK